MNSYNDLYQMCDLVLALFITRETRLTEEDIHSSLNDKKLRNLRTAISQLVTEGCIDHDNAASGHWYLLKGKGADIYEMGGFKEYFKELKRKDELKEILDQYQIDTSKSVIKTNDIVQANVNSQERLTKYALTIAAIAAVIPLITLVKDIVLSGQPIDKDTKLIMTKQKVVIDSLQQSLDSANASLKNLKATSYFDTLNPK